LSEKPEKENSKEEGKNIIPNEKKEETPAIKKLSCSEKTGKIRRTWSVGEKILSLVTAPDALGREKKKAKAKG